MIARAWEGVMSILKKWLWQRSAFLLTIFVLGGLILGWFLPYTREEVVAFAIAQIVLAMVVLVKEDREMANER
jgi:hypothetical protein